MSQHRLEGIRNSSRRGGKQVWDATRDASRKLWQAITGDAEEGGCESAADDCKSAGNESETAGSE